MGFFENACSACLFVVKVGVFSPPLSCMYLMQPVSREKVFWVNILGILFFYFSLMILLLNWIVGVVLDKEILGAKVWCY